MDFEHSAATRGPPLRETRYRHDVRWASRSPRRSSTLVAQIKIGTLGPSRAGDEGFSCGLCIRAPLGLPLGLSAVRVDAR